MFFNLLRMALVLTLPAQQLIAQIEVKTVVEDLKASGGVTASPDGMLIVSDFGDALNAQGQQTKVYEYEPATGVVRLFGEGFSGASGAAFDRKGNFYQSNPKGHKISKRSADGTWQLDWVTDGLQTPIGIAVDENENLFVCNCVGQNIVQISPEGQLDTFATSEHFNCPNGLTRDYYGNLYACNFNDGKVLKINHWGEVEVWAELPVLQGGPNPVGTGHLAWVNGNLFVTTIGTGEIFVVHDKNNIQKLCGINKAFTNTDGSTETATFSKPNGIAALGSGDTLFVNCSDPSWVSNPLKLHPAPLRMITGVCNVQGVHCWTRDEQEAIDLIKSNTVQFSRAYMQRDYEKIANSYTIDGKIMPGGARIISGKEEIRKRWILPDDQKVIHHRVFHEDIKILRDEAYDYGYYEGTTEFANGKTEDWKGKYLIIWKKEDEHWKIFVDIWNRVR